MTVVKASKPKRNRLLTKSKGQHKDDEVFGFKHMIEDDMDAVIRVFGLKVGDNMLENRR